MSTLSAIRSLHQLARLYNVQIAYYDVSRRRQQASPQSLLHVLRALGAAVHSPQDVSPALETRRFALWERCIDRVVIAWDDAPVELEVRLAATRATGSMACELQFENGEVRKWTCRLEDLADVGGAELGGARYVAKRLTISAPLPYGYHRLHLEPPGVSCNSTLICAPTRAFGFDSVMDGRRWGVFLPLYAAHSERSWGAGDYSDLGSLSAWTADFGGDLVATLPLLPAFLDEPYAPSPYAPVSRLMWAEFYIDATSLPELQRCPSARALLESTSFENSIAVQRRSPLVDYKTEMALKRRILEELCQSLFSESSGRLERLHQFVRSHPVVDDYARFRATVEKQHAPWTAWQQRLRDGRLQEGDYDEAIRRYYLYSQWVAHEQMQAMVERADNGAAALCLDFPLGVHPQGYDAWRYQDRFVLRASMGAPPDAVFTAGQDWGAPPLHPDSMREQGYEYLVACLRHHMQSASVLRVDHVMGLHRLFWIPQGMGPEEGVYVRYPAAELYAIIALESHRNRTVIQGEDLGTVPAYVRPAMKRHGLYRSYVLQYELSSDSAPVAPPVPASCIASLNTHDMPPFAAYWQGLDIEHRLELGLLDRAAFTREKDERRRLRHALAAFLHSKGFAPYHSSQEPGPILRAILAFLSASQGPVVVVNLEDLCLETEAQNIPGTSNQYPNWQRKSRYELEALFRLPQVGDILQEVHRLRKGRSR